MTARLVKWSIGVSTGLCLVGAIIAAKADWHWIWQGLFWLLALAGMVYGSWRDPLPETRDVSACAAQPGLVDGSQYGGGNGDSGA